MHNPHLQLSNQEFAEYVRLNVQRDWYFLKYFPLQYTRTFDIKTLEGQETLPVIAETVAFDTPAPKKKRKTIGAWSGELSKIAISREKNERSIVEMQNAQFLAERNEDRQAMTSIINDIYDDTDFVVNGINAKVEADALFIASHGFKEYESKIDGKGVITKDRINFNIPDEHLFGTSAKWSETTSADGIGDLIKLMSECDKEDLSNLTTAFITKKKLAELLNQKSTKERLASDISVLSGKSKYQTFTLDDLNAYMTKLGYPTFEVINRRVNAEQPNGDAYIFSPFNDNVVVLAPSIQLGKTFYTAVPQIANSDSQQSYGSFYKVTRYGAVNPMLDVTLGEAYVQPALLNRKNLFYLNTNNSVWAEGENE